MIQENDGQKLFFGTEGADVYLLEQLASIGASRILLVTGQNSFHDSGAEVLFREVLGRKAVARFSEFGKNPTENDVCNGLNLLRPDNLDCIVAVGGGSVLDMAKLLKFFYLTDRLPGEISMPCAVSTFDGRLPIFAIPTTAGSGSEATAFAVMYENGRKVSIEHADLKPQVAILNPEFTLSMTAYQMACSGFDAFSQAIESYWAVGSTAQSRHYSTASLSLSLRYLESSVSTPNMENRQGMMKAAYLAGKAINVAKTTAAHALSYPLTAHYGVPHGHAVAVMLPWVFELNAMVSDADVNDPRGSQFVQNSVGDLCRILGFETALNASRWIKDLAIRIGLDERWCGENKLNVDAVRSQIAQGVNHERLQNNPRRVTREMIDWITSHII